MKTALLLSGGVDSSVALRILKEEGHDVTAFYLKIWLQDEFSFLGDCPWEEDLEFAREVCKQAKIPLEVLSLQSEYWDTVVSYTITEIKSGRTPNPDIFCNSLIKFGEFYKKISPDYEKVASGHYARVEFDTKEERYLLKTSPDPIKDQTYFLAYLTEKQLSRAQFPIGVYSKNEIRMLAEKYDLPNKKRKDSQGICFLGQFKFNDFIKEHLGVMKGEILELESGKRMGEHEGYYYFTIGQRTGLKLGGGPWYVVKKDPEQNIIFISRENKSERARNIFEVANFNWLHDPPVEGEDLKVKIRHGAKFYNCRFNYINAERGRVTLEEFDQGIAPGQFAVFYRGDVVAGGTVID
jgi:tRNA-5-taurinomethyluridine 2-sulfurtransferase